MIRYNTQVSEGNYTIQLATDNPRVHREIEKHIRHCIDTEWIFGDGLWGTRIDHIIIDEESDAK